jgi:hypothetical protein
MRTCPQLPNSSFKQTPGGAQTLYVTEPKFVAEWQELFRSRQPPL